MKNITQKSALSLAAALSATLGTSFLAACAAPPSPPENVFSSLLDLPDGSHVILVAEPANPESAATLVVKQSHFANDKVTNKDGTPGLQKCSTFHVILTKLQEDHQYHLSHSGSFNGNAWYSSDALSMEPAALLAIKDDPKSSEEDKIIAWETQRCVFVPDVQPTAP